MTGKELEYAKHVQLEFGEYVQTHEEHTNDMYDQTTGAIFLGPNGNNQSFKRSPSHLPSIDQITNAPRSHTTGDTNWVRTAHAQYFNLCRQTWE